jgi:RNA-directed DNA polymerase
MGGEDGIASGGGKPKYLLLEKVKALYTLLHPWLEQFPKSAKFTLRARIEDSILDALRHLVLQNYRRSDGGRRKSVLEALASIQLTRVLLQQALVFKYISYQHYESACALIGEISAMASSRLRNLSAGGVKMRAFDRVYPEVVSLPSLYRAYALASKGKKSASFIRFSGDLHASIGRLHKELMEKTYKPSPYTVFYVDDYKRRRIMAPDFRDHVVHHAVCLFLEQMYEPSFIYDSFACRRGKGVHKAFRRLKRFLNRSGEGSYFMKCDVTKFFYSIDHHALKAILRRKILDQDFLWLLDAIIDSHVEDAMPYHIPNPLFENQEKGVPIGNLTSQHFANIYLNELDFHVKHNLGVKHYIRYMDDFIVLSEDKDNLHELWVCIRDFLGDSLRLRLEASKTQINRVRNGVDFTGYVARGRFIRVRTRNYRRFRARLKKRISGFRGGRIPLESLEASLISYLGHLSHTNSEKIKEEITELLFKVTASNSGAVIRGRNWNNEGNAGVFTVNLNNDPSNVNNNIGFRCCAAPAADAPPPRGAEPVAGAGDAVTFNPNNGLKTGGADMTPVGCNPPDESG